VRQWYRSGHPVHWLATRSQEMPRSIIVLYGLIFYNIYIRMIYIYIYIYVWFIYIYILFVFALCVCQVYACDSVSAIYIYTIYIVYVQTIPAYGFCIYMILLHLYTHMFSHDINMKKCIFFYISTYAGLVDKSSWNNCLYRFFCGWNSVLHALFLLVK